MDYLQINELYHHGIKGQKWGVRRFTNEDGSLNDEGKKRYNVDSYREISKNEKRKAVREDIQKVYDSIKIPDSPEKQIYDKYMRKKGFTNYDDLENMEADDLLAINEDLEKATNKQIEWERSPLRSKQKELRSDMDKLEPDYIKKQAGAGGVISAFTAAPVALLTSSIGTKRMHDSKKSINYSRVHFWHDSSW